MTRKTDIQPTEFDLSRNVVSERKARGFATGRDRHPKDIVVGVRDVKIGGRCPVMIAGPCSVDGRKAYLDSVKKLSDLGVRLIRSNVFKFRTYPDSFQGVGVKGVEWLREARERYGVAIVSEVLDVSQVEVLSDHVDLFQVGARSMANTELLKTLAAIRTPVLLKRMYAATIGEFLAAAEYLVRGGNRRVVLCERGIRSFDTWTRFSLDVPGIALVRSVSALPIIADISHSLGRTDVAVPVARAALAAGAQGLMVEVHIDPRKAKSDASQQMNPEQFAAFLDEVGLRND